MQNNVSDKRGKIVEILKTKGPSLPVQIARETQISSIFAGAFLSELAKEKEIKISNMKVGGSPLYFLQGQESSLEKFHEYLPSKEKEAFLLLKEKKILEDKKQLPAIRVALRSLKDFAYPFLKDDEVFWRFHSVTEEEVRGILEPKITSRVKKEIKEKPREEKPKEQSLKTEIKPAKKQKPKKENPIKKETQLDIGLEKQVEMKKNSKKPIEKPEFVLKTINALQNNKIEIIEEREIKKREFSGIIKVNSELGKMKFFCVAKDKKKITENDLRLAIEKSQTLKMPALVLFPQEINKKALKYAENYPLLKLKKLQ